MNFLGSGLSFNSWHFFIFAVVSVVFCRIFGNTWLRTVLLLVLNCYFVSHFISNLTSLVFLVSVLLIIYILGLYKRTQKGNQFSALGQLAVVVGIWGTLFLVKDPQLFSPANPFFYFPVQVIGLSYLMFRGISYVMEVDLVEDRSFPTYLNYMLFFPILLAGPIERYRDFSAKLHLITGDAGTVHSALHRIVNGLLKKYVLADNLIAFSTLSTSDLTNLPAPMIWLAALSALLIVYFDFSGYCDIVIGLAQLMGFKLHENFNHPFMSTNVQMFWERWHITLGQLLRDYVFNPLVKFSIKHTHKRYHNLLFVVAYCFTMVLVALWHGTTTGFLVFGIVQALALIIYQVKQRIQVRYKNIYSLSTGAQTAINGLSMIGTYSFVSISLLLWMTNWNDILSLLKKMAGY